MDQLNFVVAVGLSLAIGALLGLLLRSPVQQYFSVRRQERELAQLFEATNRQQQIERLNERRDLYLSFRNAAAAMVEELADGGGRWASFYLARDLLRELNNRARPDVAMAARQMCFVCQVMLNSGFSDELSVKFDRALQRFEAACQQDLAVGAETPVWPAEDSSAGSPDEAETASTDEPRRRYFHVMR